MYYFNSNHHASIHVKQ